MTGDYFDRLNKAVYYLQLKAVDAPARLAYLMILHKWNDFRRPKQFFLSDRDLQCLTGLSSKSITASKRKLKNLGLIDFKASREGTKYFFTDTADTHSKPCSDTPQTARSTAQPDISTTNKVSIKEGRLKTRGREGQRQVIEF